VTSFVLNFFNSFTVAKKQLYYKFLQTLNKNSRKFKKKFLCFQKCSNLATKFKIYKYEKVSIDYFSFWNVFAECNGAMLALHAT
jgi:hypothetical protein